MRDMAKFAVKIKRHEAKGNANAQAQHDGVTVAGIKYQGVALQWIATEMRANIVIAVAFKRCSDGTSHGVATLVEQALIDQCDMECGTQLRPGQAPNLASIRSDAAAAAAGVANLMHEVEGELCYMHGFDKIGASAVGELVRTKDGKPVNPFAEGKELMKVAQGIANHFSRSSQSR